MMSYDSSVRKRTERMRASRPRVGGSAAEPYGPEVLCLICASAAAQAYGHALANGMDSIGARKVYLDAYEYMASVHATDHPSSAEDDEPVYDPSFE